MSLICVEKPLSMGMTFDAVQSLDVDSLIDSVPDLEPPLATVGMAYAYMFMPRGFRRLFYKTVSKKDIHRFDKRKSISGARYPTRTKFKGTQKMRRQHFSNRLCVHHMACPF